MTILAITPFTGSEKLVKMTEAMLLNLESCINRTNEKFTVVAMNNGASRPLFAGLYDWQGHNKDNVGFGVAVNVAIQREMSEDVTHVLVLNNDLQFPHENWLSELLAARSPEELHVLSPCTDITATAQARTDGPQNLHPFYATQVSAFCWLVPAATIRLLRKKFGFQLFNPDFTNYGSDDVTGACLRKIIDKRPFKVVSRSWVKHLKGQTSAELGIRAGTKDLLQRIKNYKRSQGLT